MGLFSLSCPYSIQYSQDWKCNHLTLKDKGTLLGKLRILVSFLRGTRISRGVRALTALESGRADSDPQAPVSWPHSLPSCHQAAPSSHCPAICSYCLFRKNKFWNPHHAPLCGHTVPCNVLTLHSVTHSCLTLCDPMDCSLPGSSAHGILQARRLECCRALLQGIFPTQDQTQVFHIAGNSLPSAPPGNYKKPKVILQHLGGSCFFSYTCSIVCLDPALWLLQWWFYFWFPVLLFLGHQVPSLAHVLISLVYLIRQSCDNLITYSSFRTFIASVLLSGFCGHRELDWIDIKWCPNMEF